MQVPQCQNKVKRDRSKSVGVIWKGRKRNKEKGGKRKRINW
jgi:hypothetical protein